MITLPGGSDFVASVSAGGFIKGSNNTTNDTNPAKASIIVSLNTVPELLSPDPNKSSDISYPFNIKVLN
jgi:hypothetical protein